MKLNNEEKAILRILKDYEIEYNANSLSKIIRLTSMGSLKILKRLEKQELIKVRKVSNIKFYDFNFDSSYAKDYAALIFKKEADSSSAFVKRWVNELRKVKLAEIGIIFGSVLTKEKNANDIDVLFVVKKKNFLKLKNEIEKLNKLNDKKIHPIYQTKEDIVHNLKINEKVILEIIKGILIFGEKNFVEILEQLK